MNNELYDEGFYLGKIEDDHSILEGIGKFDDDDIMAVAEDRIAHRGYEYYISSNIRSWEEVGEELSVSVEGSYRNQYTVLFFRDDNDLLGVCNCPYDDTCKHIVAALFYLKYKCGSVENRVSHQVDEDAITRKELENMQKEKLVSLVMQFAPESYKKSIVLQYLSKDEVEDSLEKIEKVLSHILNGDQFLYNPNGLFDVLSSLLDDLSAHLKVAPIDVFDIVVSMMEGVERMEDEGYLYQERCNWYEESEYFEYDILNDKILKMINNVEDPELQAEVLLEYLRTCGRSNYFYCNLKAVKIKDKSLLVADMNEIKTIDFYDFMKSEISYAEKLFYLKNFDTDKVISRVVDAHVAAGKKDEAIDYVESLLAERFKVDDAELLLDLVPVKDMKEEQICTLLKRAISSREYHAYDFVMTYMNECTETEILEDLMKKEKIHWYYTYLEKYKRVEEMHSILGKVSGEKNNFYHQYKMQYKDEAITFYKARINADLPYTGNNYYESIASYLKELKPLLPKEEFSTIIMNLKTNYKRRRNFVKILAKHFE